MTPPYFASLWGAEAHWRLVGSHIVYYASPGGFRVYLELVECRDSTRCIDKPASAAHAEAAGWHVVWLGVERASSAKGGTLGDKAGNSAGGGRGVRGSPRSEYVVQDMRGRDASGVHGPPRRGTDNTGSTPTWQRVPDGSGIALQVSMRASSFVKRPALVSTVLSDHQHWSVTGSGSVHGASRMGFQLFLGRARSASFARLYEWRVGYIGYDGPWPIACAVSQWSTWTDCQKTCRGANAPVPLPAAGARASAACAALPQTAGALARPCASARHAIYRPAPKIVSLVYGARGRPVSVAPRWKCSKTTTAISPPLIRT